MSERIKLKWIGGICFFFDSIKESINGIKNNCELEITYYKKHEEEIKCTWVNDSSWFFDDDDDDYPITIYKNNYFLGISVFLNEEKCKTKIFIPYDKIEKVVKKIRTIHDVNFVIECDGILKDANIFEDRNIIFKMKDDLLYICIENEKYEIKKNEIEQLLIVFEELVSEIEKNRERDKDN